jgi:hypothetical protein
MCPQLKSALPSAQKGHAPTNNIHVFVFLGFVCWLLLGGFSSEQKGPCLTQRSLSISSHRVLLSTCVTYILPECYSTGFQVAQTQGQKIVKGFRPIAFQSAAWTYSSPHLVQSTKQGVVPMLEGSQLGQPSVVGEVNINSLDQHKLDQQFWCFDSRGAWSQLLANSFGNFLHIKQIKPKEWFHRLAPGTLNSPLFKTTYIAQWGFISRLAIPIKTHGLEWGAWALYGKTWARNSFHC